MNKNYLKYLFKSKKALSLFVVISEVVLYALILISSGLNKKELFSTLNYLSFYVSMVLTFELPILCLSFILNKKAVDTYFSLPVKRKELLITTLIYCLIVIMTPVLLLALFSLIYFPYNLNSLSSLLITLVMVATLLVFNSGIYLIGNNIFDGLVMLWGYQVLPLLINLCISAYLSYMCYGYTYYGTKFIRYTSLVAQLSTRLSNVVELNENIVMANTTIIQIVLCAFAYLIIGIISLKYNFIDRKVERAESVSDNLFGYKFLIHVAVIGLVFITTISYANKPSIIELLKSTIIWFALILILYTATTFIYKRKFSLNKYNLVFYVALVILSLLGSKYCYMKEGFGLSYTYDSNPKNMIVSGNASNLTDKIVENYNLNIADDKFIDTDKYCYIGFEYRFDENNPKLKEAISYFNNMRNDSIKSYFKGNNEYLGNLQITTNYNDKLEWYFYDEYECFNYNNIDYSLDDLKYINDNFGEVTINLEYYDELTDTYKAIYYSIDEIIEGVNYGG